MYIKEDVLKSLAEYFNVTIDYLFGISKVKRDLQGQARMNKTLNKYYNLEMLWSMIQIVKNGRKA